MKRFLLTMFICIMSNNLYADPFTNAPGERARAMGGAFAAIADDSSCFWHNPAGLAIMKANIDIQFSAIQALVRKPEPENLNNAIIGTHQKYDIKTGDLSFSIGAGFGPGSIIMYYHKPYFINHHYNPRKRENIPIVESAFGQVNEEIYSIGVGYGLSSSNKKYSLGWTIDYLNMKSNYSNIWQINGYNDQNDTTFYRYIGSDGRTYDARSGSIGIMMKPFDNFFKSYLFSIGSVYRLPCHGIRREKETDTFLEEYFKVFYPAFAAHLVQAGPFFDQLIIERPPSFDLGLAIRRQGNSRLSLAVQYGFVDWSHTNRRINTDYNKYSVGMEYVAQNKYLFNDKITLLSLRTGYYYSKPTPLTDDWPEVEGLTFGLGISSGAFAFEVALENRIIDYLHNEKEENLLVSFSVSISSGINIDDIVKSQ